MNSFVNITDVCIEIFAGGDAPKSNMSENKTDAHRIPIFSNGEANGGLYGYTNFARVTKPSITVSARGTIGFVAVRNEPFVPIVRLISLTPKPEKIEIKYLYYAIQNYKFDCSGTSIPQLTVPMLKKYSFPLPTKQQQLAIIEQLDSVSNLISFRKQQLLKLDELVKSRFIEMFGDRFVNDRNWESRPLYECADFYNGKAHEQVVDENGAYILVTSRCIASDITDYRRTNALLFPLQVNDIVMVMSDVPNGRALAKCLLIDENNRYSLNQRICCLRNYSLNPIYFYYLLNRHEYFLSFDDGNAQTNLRKDDLLACNIIIPPMELQTQFATFVEQVDKSKFEIQKSLEKLETLKKSLMQKYFG